MKKLMCLLVLFMLLSGCSNDKKEISCIYKDESKDSMKSYMRVTMVYDKNIVLTEKLNAVYQFPNTTEASANYSKIEKVLEKDDTVNIRQVEERIAADGEKDVSSMQYDPEAKVAYYEELGYTCE